MDFSDIGSLLSMAQFGGKVISYVKNKRMKIKPTSKPRKHRQSREQKLIQKLMENPEQALKEMGAEYLVKNRKKIGDSIVKTVGDYILGEHEMRLDKKKKRRKRH